MTDPNATPRDLRDELEDAAEALGRKARAIGDDPRVVALDTGIGKWVARAKALAWSLGAGLVGLVGWALYAFLSGNPAYVAASGAGAVALFALFQAWRNLTKPVRIS